MSAGDPAASRCMVLVCAGSCSSPWLPSGPGSSACSSDGCPGRDDRRVSGGLRSQPVAGVGQERRVELVIFLARWSGRPPRRYPGLRRALGAGRGSSCSPRLRPGPRLGLVEDRRVPDRRGRAFTVEPGTGAAGLVPGAPPMPTFRRRADPSVRQARPGDTVDRRGADGCPSADQRPCERQDLSPNVERPVASLFDAHVDPRAGLQGSEIVVVTVHV